MSVFAFVAFWALILCEIFTLCDVWKVALVASGTCVALGELEANWFRCWLFVVRRGWRAAAGVATSGRCSGRSGVLPIPGIGMQSLASLTIATVTFLPGAAYMHLRTSLVLVP